MIKRTAKEKLKGDKYAPNTICCPDKGAAYLHLGEDYWVLKGRTGGVEIPWD